MSASRYVGRVGGLAVAFGVGATVFSGVAVATADTGTGPAGSSDTANSSDTAKSPARAGRVARAAAAAARANDPTPGSAAPRPAAATASVPADAGRSAARKSRPAPAAAARAALRAERSSALKSLAAAAVPAGAETSAAAIAVAALPSSPSAPLPIFKAGPTAAPPAAAAVRPFRAALAGPRAILAKPASAGAVTSTGMRSDSTAPLPPELFTLVAAGALQIAVSLSTMIFNHAPPSPLSTTTALVVNGTELVPSSPQVVTSHYGRWSYFPGGLSMVQGNQHFDVVDPATSQPIGNVDALVTKGVGLDYLQLLITSSAGSDVGAGPGQVPPKGSLISTLKLGPIGLMYTAVPTASGNVVSGRLLTPWGDFSMPSSFDAAKGFADQSVDDRPVNLGNGYSIAPADPFGETFTATTGFPSIFSAIQGSQAFNVYDAAGNVVGGFDGVFTTTSDVTGLYTQAIMVTANGGTNVGTEAGQVPPVGSVYNIIYIGTDEKYFLYSSLPSSSGDVVSIVQADSGTFKNVAPTLINASKPPAVKPLSTPEGYTFVPASPLVPSGVNGLPPREVQIQGYQQFDVYDPSGTRVGRVDADVTTQWDMFGIYSQAILITDVAEGADSVPPVGSIFNFAEYFKGALGTAHSTVPGPTADVTSFVVRTPLGDIDFPAVSRAASDRTDVLFFSPFRTV